MNYLRRHFRTWLVQSQVLITVGGARREAVGVSLAYLWSSFGCGPSVLNRRHPRDLTQGERVSVCEEGTGQVRGEVGGPNARSSPWTPGDGRFSRALATGPLSLPSANVDQRAFRAGER
jgi:hypothetical protein